MVGHISGDRNRGCLRSSGGCPRLNFAQFFRQAVAGHLLILAEFIVAALDEECGDEEIKWQALDADHELVGGELKNRVAAVTRPIPRGNLVAVEAIFVDVGQEAGG